LAEPLFVESLVLVAVTDQVPAKVGAVYTPVAEIEPPFVVHFTLALAAPPTMAVNCCVAPI
jgi:hypothetical protein